MPRACERFEPNIISGFREVKTNSLLLRITDQQLRHFRHQWGVRKVGKRQFPTSVRIPCRNFYFQMHFNSWLLVAKTLSMKI